jgi:hypothetical protein
VVNLRRLFWINRIAGATIIILVLIGVITWTIRHFLIT